MQPTDEQTIMALGLVLLIAFIAFAIHETYKAKLRRHDRKLLLEGINNGYRSQVFENGREYARHELATSSDVQATADRLWAECYEVNPDFDDFDRGIAEELMSLGFKCPQAPTIL